MRDACAFQIFNDNRVLIDHEECLVGVKELLADEGPDPSVTADDVMIAHPHDCLVQPSPPEITLHLTLYYKPGEGCKHVCSRPNP